jgi:acetate kinase
MDARPAAPRREDVPVSEAILVLNAGSSSIKFSVYRLTETPLALAVRGQVTGLGTSPHFRAVGGDKVVLVDTSLPSSPESFRHAEAFAHAAQWLRGHFGGQLMLAAAGHRVVHGGQEFAAPARIDDDVLARLRGLIPLAPLHQPNNIAGIEAVRQAWPDLPQVACFDTAFHRSRTMVAQRFALPDGLFRQGVRRWGFHGLSYESIVGRFRQLAGELAEGRVIAAHMGNGVSMCALRAGRSVDTTMGFTALDGLPMGTRCGSLDPGVVLHLLRQMGATEVEDLLYTKSGLLGLSGLSSDVRELLASAAPRAAEALDYFVYRAVREVGALTAALGGLDALIFTAGIGENSPVIRRRICEGLGWLGVKLDAQANERNAATVSPPGQRPSVWVIPTDEEGIIAAQTVAAIPALSRGAMQGQ